MTILPFAFGIILGYITYLTYHRDTSHNDTPAILDNRVAKLPGISLKVQSSSNYSPYFASSDGL